MDKIQSAVIMFLDNQFKDKEYIQDRPFGWTDYYMDNHLYFTYHRYKNNIETSNYLDDIILQYIPDYKPMDDEMRELVNDWGQKNLSK